MKTFIHIAVCLLVFSSNLQAQDMSAYEKKLFIRGRDTLPYRILLPENYDKSAKYPLIIVLHGAADRGKDNELQLRSGGKFFLQPGIRKEHPAIIVYPQCPESSFWSNVDVRITNGKTFFGFKVAGEPTAAMQLLEQLVKKVIQDNRVDRQQVYVGGVAMGGMGTFELVRRMPNVFAAAFPICGGANPSTAQEMKKTSWWIFHGARDEVVPSVLSEIMVNAMQGIKADVKYTLYPQGNHSNCDTAFAEPGLLPWLFSKTK